MTVSIPQALATFSTEQDLRAAHARLGLAMPQTGWLDKYVRTCVSLTDAPVEFHLASGLAAIAAAIGNRTWFVGWGARTFPHVWIVLVAGSSFMRKSTSVGLASDLLVESVPEALFPADFSREGFLDELAQQPWGLLVQNEFGEFLAKMQRDFMKGSQQTFTNLYDGRTLRRRTVGGGSKLISAPAVTILSATTIEWLERELTEGDIAGGFIPRFAWVTASVKASDKGRGEEFPTLVRNELVRGLQAIGRRGPAAARFEQDAVDRIDDWRRSFEERAEAETHGVSIKGFGARLTTMAWKFAMLYALSDAAWEVEEHVTVSGIHAERAVAYADLLYSNVADLVDDDIATTDDQRTFRRILHICAGRGVSWSDLLRHTGMQSPKLRPFVATLVERRQLVSEQVTPAAVGLDRQRQRPLEWLRAVPRKSSTNGSLRVQEFSSSEAYGFTYDADTVQMVHDDVEPQTVAEPLSEPLITDSIHDSSYSSTVRRTPTRVVHTREGQETSHPKRSTPDPREGSDAVEGEDVDDSLSAWTP